MVSGAKEVESFWVFNSLMEKRLDEPPIMDGLTDFYTEGFPLTFKYIEVFNRFFIQILPDLREHFEQESVFPQLWLLKWF